MMNRALKKSQKLFAQQLIHRCDVFAKKRTRVGSQWQEVYMEVVHQHACRMSTKGASDSERNTENQQKFVDSYTLFSLPMDIKQDYRVLLYTKQGATWIPGSFYEVKGVPRDPSFIGHHYEVPCEVMPTTYTIVEMNGIRILE